MYVGKLKRALICTRSYWPMMCFQAPDMVRANDVLARAQTHRRVARVLECTRALACTSLVRALCSVL